MLFDDHFSVQTYGWIRVPTITAKVRSCHVLGAWCGRVRCHAGLSHLHSQAILYTKCSDTS